MSQRTIKTKCSRIPFGGGLYVTQKKVQRFERNWDILTKTQQPENRQRAPNFAVSFRKGISSRSTIARFLPSTLTTRVSTPQSLLGRCSHLPTDWYNLKAPQDSSTGNSTRPWTMEKSWARWMTRSWIHGACHKLNSQDFKLIIAHFKLSYFRRS